MTTLQITKVNCPADKYTTKCPYLMTPTGITIHNTANDASAMSEISYMLSNNNQVSYHYAVDDTRAVQGINLNQNAWHAGDGANGTGNRKTIGIEICYSKSGGAKYKKAFDNTLTLVATLMKQYGFKSTQIYYHQTWSGKHCPHRTLDEGITLDKFRKLAQDRYNELYNKPKLESYKGYVTVIYNGKEGLALHNKASWSDDTISSIAKKGKVFTIVGRIKVNNVYMYKLKDGQYITSSTKYVKYSNTKPIDNIAVVKYMNAKDKKEYYMNIYKADKLEDINAEGYYNKILTIGTEGARNCYDKWDETKKVACGTSKCTKKKGTKVICVLVKTVKQ